MKTESYEIVHTEAITYRTYIQSTGDLSSVIRIVIDHPGKVMGQSVFHANDDDFPMQVMKKQDGKQEWVQVHPDEILKARNEMVENYED